MTQKNPVEVFMEELGKKGTVASFLLIGHDFYMELGERTLESAKAEKEKYPDVGYLKLVVRGGSGLGGITI